MHLGHPVLDLLLSSSFLRLVPSHVVVVAKVSEAAVEAASALTLYSALTFHFLFITISNHSLSKDSF